MYKFVIALTFAYLVMSTQARTIYYPDTKDPNAIVFEGPTNVKEVTTNEVDTQDYSKLVDVRQIKEACPPGFSMVGEVCFPND